MTRIPSALDCEPKPPRPRGGPRTDAGKRRSRTNATQHGLTATTLLPAILGPEGLQKHLFRLRAEWQPQTPTQEFLVTEIARHAAALDLVEHAELAVLRTGASTMAQLRSASDDSEHAADHSDDVLLAAAVSSDALDHVTRYRRAHEKAFHQALQRLRELRSQPPSYMRDVRLLPPFLFAETTCRDYLLRRVTGSAHACPRCGHATGCWLATRETWQCARCRRQSGLRAGTVMANSPLPLSVWFGAIWQILIDPVTSVKELARAAKITRPNTAGDVADKIRAALGSPNATLLLAGLNELHHPPTMTC